MGFQWEGYGNNKVWAKIPGTCKQNPYDKCQDVTKTKEKQVAYPVCNDVPEQKCVDIPKKVCDTTGTGYGYSSNTHNTQQPTNPEVVLDIGRANPNTNLLKNNKIVFADK